MNATMNIVCIGIGSNLGNRAAYVNFAREQLDELPDTHLAGFSSLHETAPVGPQDQDYFINAAAVIHTLLSPEQLIQHLMWIEQLTGRERREKWGPRTLDLDILLFGDQIVNTPDLTIPHPHMHERAFVLNPLNEIAPDHLHPILNQTVAQLHLALQNTST